jgi:uncharacterized membrane protein
MADAGPLAVMFVLLGLSAYVLIPALAIALGLRLAGVGRNRKPEAILQRRLATGEITKAEFDSAMTALGR